MPIQSSSILKNTGPKQDLDYWIWAHIPPTSLAGPRIVRHPNGKDTILAKYGFIFRVGSDGRIVWTRNDPSGTQTYGLVTDSSGNIYTCGGDTVIIKYDLSGNVVLARSINSGGSSTNPDLAIGSNTGSMYCATADSSGNALLFRLDSNGSFLWARKISGVSSQFQYVAVDEPNNRVYAAGYASTTTNGFDANLVAFDLNGTVQWQKKFGVPEINYAIPTGVRVHNNEVYIGFRMGINGACPIFKYSSSGSLLTFSGLLGLWGADDFFGNAYFNIDSSNGDIVITYRSGTIRKYNSSGSAIIGRRFTPGYSGFWSDVDPTNGDMYFLHFSSPGATYSKLKADGSGTGVYGPVTYSASATSSHYPDNSMQAWEDPSSYSIISATLTSISTSHSGVTGNPSGIFAPLRTK
jgi:hypothetical protein